MMRRKTLAWMWSILLLVIITKNWFICVLFFLSSLGHFVVLVERFEKY